MNAAARTALDVAALNAPPGARACIVRTDAGWQVAWQMGTAKEPFGPTYAAPREAAAASRHLNERGHQA